MAHIGKKLILGAGNLLDLRLLLLRQLPLLVISRKLNLHQKSDKAAHHHQRNIRIYVTVGAVHSRNMIRVSKCVIIGSQKRTKRKNHGNHQFFAVK